MNYNIDNPSVLIEHLLYYSIKNNIIDQADYIFMRNRLMDLLKIDEPDIDTQIEIEELPETPTPILELLLDYAWQNNVINDNTLTTRDLFDTAIMGVLMPKPSEIIEKFITIKHSRGVEYATDYFYTLCLKCNYIRMDRIAQNIIWKHSSVYGDLEITINLTKPEKDPIEIALLRNAPDLDYPKCLLCIDNVGYSGRINFPARQTLRALPIVLNNEQWYIQFSPYVYYNHHCIAFSHDHYPMKINKNTFIRLFDFLDQFPHYFIGSNAGLPIIGGSILNHDHFQGGYHVMPMAVAPAEQEFIAIEFQDVHITVIKWPMSTIRIRSHSRDNIIELCNCILRAWESYSDPTVDILASSADRDGVIEHHNSITPIARMSAEGLYEMDLVLRNNRTSSEHPMGIFHPHQELHNIKKENIGLIEVMGLFILPSRLQSELTAIKDFLTGKSNFDTLESLPEDDNLNKHAPWIKQLLSNYGSNLSSESAELVIRREVGNICLEVLNHASVFKANSKGKSALRLFLANVNIFPK